METTHNVVELTDSDDDDDEYLSSEAVHKVENVTNNKNDQPEAEEYQAEELNMEYGSEMIIRKQLE